MVSVLLACLCPCSTSAPARYGGAWERLGLGAFRAGAKNATFCAIYIYERSFCQDRLGTNMGKTQKRVAFFAGGAIDALPRGGARERRRSDCRAHLAHAAAATRTFRERLEGRGADHYKVIKRSFLALYIYRNDHFTKTGSGQT
jgi:hypothetical protein